MSTTRAAFFLFGVLLLLASAESTSRPLLRTTSASIDGHRATNHVDDDATVSSSSDAAASRHHRHPLYALLEGPASELIENLPGYGAPPFPQYSGRGREAGGSTSRVTHTSTTTYQPTCISSLVISSIIVVQLPIPCKKAKSNRRPFPRVSWTPPPPSRARCSTTGSRARPPTTGRPNPRCCG